MEFRRVLFRSAQHLHSARAGAAGVGPSLGRRDQDGIQGFRVLADTTSDQAHSILPGSRPPGDVEAPGEQSRQTLALSVLLYEARAQAADYQSLDSTLPGRRDRDETAQKYSTQ